MKNNEKQMQVNLGIIFPKYACVKIKDTLPKTNSWPLEIGQLPQQDNSLWTIQPLRDMLGVAPTQ